MTLLLPLYVAEFLEKFAYSAYKEITNKEMHQRNNNMWPVKSHQLNGVQFKVYELKASRLVHLQALKGH